MMRKTTVSLLLFLILLLVGCKETVDYKYSDGLKTYLAKIIKTPVDVYENRVFYIMPLNNCEPCLALNLDMLTKVPEGASNLNIIFIGSNKDIKWEAQLSEIRREQKYINDTTGLIYNYETGLGKPILAHFLNGRLHYILNVTDDKVNEASEYMAANGLE